MLSSVKNWNIDFKLVIVHIRTRNFRHQETNRTIKLATVDNNFLLHEHKNEYHLAGQYLILQEFSSGALLTSQQLGYHKKQWNDRPFIVPTSKVRKANVYSYRISIYP